MAWLVLAQSTEPKDKEGGHSPKGFIFYQQMFPCCYVNTYYYYTIIIFYDLTFSMTLQVESRLITPIVKRSYDQTVALN